MTERPSDPSRTVEFLVGGSGPAAAGACQALLDADKSCTVVDLGSRLEPDRHEAVDRLRSVEPELWSEDDLALTSGDMNPSLAGVAVKTVFGSKYPYYDSDGEHALLDLHGSLLGASQGLGGFTSVWGSAALPFVRGDMTGWPMEAELEPAYARMQRVVPVTRHDDALSALFHIGGPHVAPIPLTPQVDEFEQHLKHHAKALRRRGFIFGRGSVAVGAAGDVHRNSCKEAGRCLEGCPYGSIFNAGDLVLRYAREGRIRYLGGLEIDRVEHDGRSVLVRCVERSTGALRTVRAKRVFLGCGVVPTARIVAASLRLGRLSVPVKDTCYFLIPFLRFAAVSHFRKAGFRLTQGFLQLEPGTISQRRINLQVYGYNALFETLADRVLRPLFGSWRWPRDALLSRLMLLQGYLHSDDSPQLTLGLERVSGSRYRATTTSESGRRARLIVRRLLAKLLYNARGLGGVPVVPMVKIENPGRGFHFGATFPMRVKPSAPYETDLLGNLPSLPSVHLVDASVFPSIPPTTIALTAMANAYRIASAVAQGATA